ncbi:MAG: glutamate-cysteine ligase family protein [Bacteroidota bacterium]|nr:glutamate-cysteine ligase family protein [Bacteroidota bacterium]
MLKLHLFQGFGVELEYMIVDRDTLKVLPVTDKILKDFHGSFIDEIENGAISWSNELALHVIELKTNGPAKNLEDLAGSFSQNVKDINNLLKSYNGMLMPTAMHPFMDPFSEMKLWPHERNEIYEKYNSIFDCKGHGWANLQSVHINLPFANDEEFAKLHAAIRLILPILPALAASSPIKDGSYSGLKDTRLDVYQNNQKRVPSISGKVIPEPVFSEKDYVSQILEKIYHDIAPYDPEGILQDEWLNSRGAIARFQRNAIEIRVLDIQESPAADLAIIKLIVATVQNLVQEKWTPLEDQKKWEVDPLFKLLQDCIKQGENSQIINKDYLKTFGYKGESAKVVDLWKYLLQENIQTGYPFSDQDLAVLNIIFDEGTLSSRIQKALGPEIEPNKIIAVYRKLSECLANNSIFKN